MTALNRCLDEPRTVTLVLHGLAPPRQAVVDRLVPASLGIAERTLRRSQETLAIVAGRIPLTVPAASIVRLRLE